MHRVSVRLFYRAEPQEIFPLYETKRTLAAKQNLCGYFRGLNEIDEAAVNTPVSGKLGVKSSGHGVSLLDEDGKTIALGEDCDFGTGGGDAGGADEYGFDRDFLVG